MNKISIFQFGLLVTAIMLLVANFLINAHTTKTVFVSYKELEHNPIKTDLNKSSNRYIAMEISYLKKDIAEIKSILLQHNNRIHSLSAALAGQKDEQLPITADYIPPNIATTNAP